MNAAMEYPQTNQRRVQPPTLTMHPNGTGGYYTQPDPRYTAHADPSTWQQAQYFSNPSPQDSSRATLSPPNTFNTHNYSSSDYLTPSPRSSHPDSWSASSNQWVSPRGSPIMDNTNVAPTNGWNGNSAEFTWNAGVPPIQPLPPAPKRPAEPRPTSLAPSSSDQRSTSGVSDNDTWAVATATGKRLRTNEKEKTKSGACKHCKRLKMKCTFDPPGAATCQRCRGSGQDCIVEGRKPRKNSEPLEQLSALIEDKQEIIDGLLKIVSRPRPDETRGADTAEVWRWIERAARSLMPVPAAGAEPEVTTEEERLPPDPTPLGLLADLSLNDPEKEDRQTKGISSSKSQTEEGDEVGVANAEYFRPGPMAHPDLRRIIVERQMVPEILTLKVVTNEEVEHLFRIFHERIDAIIAIIDPVIHTVAGVKARCPFLFTVICAVASQYWIERPELYSVLMHHAKSAAATAITDGWKSLEVCQAYLLLSIYPPPARNWVEDRSWLYLGCAVRLATDLRLHEREPTTYVNEAHERETLNRTRTWLICFNVDRELAIRHGRPTTIPEDYATRHSREWWRGSKRNSHQDISLCYKTHLLQTITRYLSLIYSDTESLTGFNWNTNFGPIIDAFDAEMERIVQETRHIYATNLDPTHPSSQYCLALTTLEVAYYRLVIQSLGLEHADKSGSELGSTFLAQSIDTASEVLRITNEEMPMYECHIYSPNGHWTLPTYAAIFLIKLAKQGSIKPQHLRMTEAQSEAILSLVERLVHTLENSAIDSQHSPALYARSLARMLRKPVLSTSMGTQDDEPDIDVFANTGPGGLCFQAYEPSLRAYEPLVTSADNEDFWKNFLLPGTWGIAAPSA